MTAQTQILHDDVQQPFMPARFGMPRRPHQVGAVGIGAIGELPSCLDMLVKLPGGAVILPEPFASDLGLMSFLSQSLDFEDALLPDWRKRYHLYLTVDRRLVQAGRSHRNEGWHFDGMQGSRYPVKLPVCHQYVLSTYLPTEYTDVPTDASELDETRHNWFRALGDQVPEDAEIIRAEPGAINLMTAYQLHRSPIAGPTEAGWRTFVRLDVSLKQQDRLGNTVNPLLPAPWDFVERKLPEGLGVPVRDSSWDGAQRFGQHPASRQRTTG